MSSTKKIKPVFKASDDSEFDTAAGAEKRERLIAAHKDFEAAADRLQIELGEQFLTADGKPFSMREVRDYWVIRDHVYEVPSVLRVSIYPHGLSFDMHETRPTVRWWSAVAGAGRDGRYEQYAIKELYYDKSAAEAECVSLMEGKLQEYTDQVRIARKKLEDRK